MTTTKAVHRRYYWDDDVIEGDEALDARIDKAMASVIDRVADIHAVAYDGCHKVYLSMNPEQTYLFQEHGYGAGGGSELVLAEHVTPEQLLQTFVDWYEESCPLRFVGAWHGLRDNPEYESIIPQVYVDEEE